MTQQHLAVVPLCWVWDDPDSELCAAWDQLAEAAGEDGHADGCPELVAHGPHPLHLWWLHDRRDRWMHEQRVRG